MRNNTLKKYKDLVIFRYIPLFIFLIFILFPFYWTIVTAFKREGDIIKHPVKYFPNPATVQNFITAWNNVGFSQFFKNSMIVSLISVVVIVFCSILVGYALSRFKFRGKKALLLVLLCTQFIPGSMLLIPLFMIFKKLMLINNLLSLVLIYATFQVPFNSILMRGFVSSIPFELEEAAMIDGCGRLGAIRVAVLPILLPGMVAAGTMAFVSCWNEFLYALMFINKTKLFTIPVGLNFMMGQFDINYGALAAGSVIAIVPALLMFAYAQKYLVGGLSAGSVKG